MLGSGQDRSPWSAASGRFSARGHDRGLAAGSAGVSHLGRSIAARVATSKSPTEIVHGSGLPRRRSTPSGRRRRRFGAAEPGDQSLTRRATAAVSNAGRPIARHATTAMPAAGNGCGDREHEQRQVVGTWWIRFDPARVDEQRRRHPLSSAAFDQFARSVSRLPVSAARHDAVQGESNYSVGCRQPRYHAWNGLGPERELVACPI